MPASEQITIAPHLTFDAITAGTPGAPLVLLLHGFAESMHCWRAQVAALGDMGYRAVAPSQRGYSPGARPDPREFSNYQIDRLMDDAMAIAAACGLWRCALSSRRPRLGRQHRLGHRRPPSRAAGLAHHSLAAASERLQSRAADARRRAGASLAAPQGVSRAGCRRRRAGRRRQMAARASGRQRRSRRRDRAASRRARQQGRDGGGARLVSRARRDPRAARPDPRADALHLGRCRRHRRPRRRRRHGRFHRRALSLRGAARRRAFCGGSGAGTCHAN